MERASRGDTLIEVMFSFAVFSLMIVGSLSLMNQGQALAERSLEITLVREQVDAQIAMAQYMQQNNPSAWQNLISTKLSSTIPSYKGLSSCPNVGDALLDKSFFFSASSDLSTVDYHTIDATSYLPAVTYARVDYLPSSPSAPKSYSLWAQIIKSETNSGSLANAYDLHVTACWDSVGSSVPMTIGTVVRLYDAS